MPSLNQTHRVPIRQTVANGAANYFAGAQTVLAPSSESVYLGGVDIDLNAFTNGALITATIIYKVGAGLVQRQYQSAMTKTAADTMWRIIGGEELLPGNANNIVINLQSDNAGDIAVAVPVSYFLRYF